MPVEMLSPFEISMYLFVGIRHVPLVHRRGSN